MLFTRADYWDLLFTTVLFQGWLRKELKLSPARYSGYFTRTQAIHSCLGYKKSTIIGRGHKEFHH